MFLIIHPTLITALWKLRTAVVSNKFGNPVIARSQFHQTVVLMIIISLSLGKKKIIVNVDWSCTSGNYQTYLSFPLFSQDKKII